MIKALIVEDEEPNIILLTGILKNDFPDVEVIAVCKTVMESIEKINVLKPDVVFLDVRLNGVNDGGFQVLDFTRSVNYDVVFTTSHMDYAAQAFKFCALHFLHRPFGTDDVKEALKRFKEKSEKGSNKNIEALFYNAKQSDPSLHKVGIPVLGGIDFITVSEIIMCNAEDNCTAFHLAGKKKVLATKTLKHFEELLRDHHFFRTHDSYMINLRHILKYKRGGEGGIVELSENKEADVSRRKKDDFLKVLSDLKIITGK